MAVKAGKFALITIDNKVIAEMGSYTLSGYVRETLEHTAFGDTFKKFVAGTVDGGDISFSGYYDPTDTDGQRTLENACESGRILTPGQLKVYIDTNHYFTVAAGGTMFVTKARSVSMEKTGLGSTDFTVKVAGAELELCDVSGSMSISKSPSMSPSLSPSKSPSLSPSASLSPSLSPSTTP
jgi:hypothetical protein